MEHIINYAHGPEFAAEPIYLTFFGIENLVLRAGRSSCGFLSNKNKRISLAWVSLAGRDHLFPRRHMPGPLDKHLQKLLLLRSVSDGKNREAFSQGRSIGFASKTLLGHQEIFF